VFPKTGGLRGLKRVAKRSKQAVLTDLIVVYYYDDTETRHGKVKIEQATGVVMPHNLIMAVMLQGI
jgi:hypothetical protein